MRKEYRTIEELIRKNFKKEVKKTRKLIDELKNVKERGYFTKYKFLKMGMWKSPRPKPRYCKNSKEEVIKISRVAFSINDVLTKLKKMKKLEEMEKIKEEMEKIKIDVLTKLKGVGIPVASAILMLTDPSNYGVIDRRAWEVLYLYGKVQSKKKSFSSNDWVTYLKILRELAQEFKVTPRDIERTLYLYHEDRTGKKEKEEKRKELEPNLIIRQKC